MRQPTWMIGTVAAALLGLACAEVPSDTQYSNLTPRWDSGDAWTVPGAALLEIGVEEGPEEYQFFRVRGGLIGPDGVIAVADGGSNSIRFYDATGQFMYSVGRKGLGPGEFEMLGAPWHHTPDTLGVHDGSTGRISLLTWSGEMARSVSPSLADDEPWLGESFGRTRSGGFYAFRGTKGMGWADVDKVIHDTLVVFAYGPEGVHEGVVQRLPLALAFGLRTGGGLTFPSLPLQVQPSHAVADGLVFLGTGRLPEVEILTADGDLQRTVRWSGVGAAVTDEVIGAYRERALASLPPSFRSAENERFLNEVDYPDRLPVYEHLLVDDLGHLWVKQYQVDLTTESVWLVFDENDVWLGEVVTPARVRVLDIAGDRILGRHRDDRGVERIRIYRVVHP